ncbi:hypothetical protein E5358_07725 [Palleniella muris]|uniref:Uncharacterized protein n=1 Tax=Palleniella muris TaxID=3038145 RepID=A0AC61QQ55_9BACT|nr:hypothetical protein [Palleniella muris]TGX82186.1 hypothetical protein E5358_07725 [Palleniella muris]
MNNCVQPIAKPAANLRPAKDGTLLYKMSFWRKLGVYLRFDNKKLALPHPTTAIRRKIRIMEKIIHDLFPYWELFIIFAA